MRETVAGANLEVFLRKIRRSSCFFRDRSNGFGCKYGQFNRWWSLLDKKLLPKYLVAVTQTSEVHCRVRWPVRRLDGM